MKKRMEIRPKYNYILSCIFVTGDVLNGGPYTTRVNLLKPNDIYIYIYVCVCVCVCLTAAQTSRRYILDIYSTNIHTKYFKHAAYSPSFLFKMPFIS